MFDNIFGSKQKETEQKPGWELIHEDKNRSYEKGFMYFVSFKDGYLKVFRTKMQRRKKDESVLAKAEGGQKNGENNRTA